MSRSPSIIPDMGSAAAAADQRGVTVERIERAICIVADMMVRHDINLMPTIRRLEAERDRLREQTSDMDYAREILRKRTQQRTKHGEAKVDISA